MRKTPFFTGVITLLLAFVSPRAAQSSEAAKDNESSTAAMEVIHVVKMPIVSKYGYRGQMGDIIELNDGQLLFAYRSGWWGGEKGPIYVRRSQDGGQTWSDDQLLVKQLDQNQKPYYGHPGFERLANGDILLSYIYAYYPYAQSYFRRSRDDGKTWSDQQTLTPHPGYNLVHNDKLLQLTSGRIVVPVDYESQSEGGDHSGYVGYTLYSDDGGLSWHPSENMVNMLPLEYQEPHVVELSDGRLMMLGRTYSGFVARAFSDNGGQSWSEGEAMKDWKLSKNASALNVKRIPATGDLLLVRCTGEGKSGEIRTPFASAISQDEGETWIHERVIAGDPEDDYGYPSMTFLRDGRTVLIGFHARNGLHMARVDVDWFYGK
jgi:sialidase-1